MTHIVVGGGWSGLAAAITLCQQGKQVHLIESAKQLGGRARNVNWHDITVDNGQHLMIGAYHQMLELFATIGINQTDAFNRYPIDISIVDSKWPSLQLSSKSVLPWPLSLASSLYRSAGFANLLCVMRLQNSIPRILKSSDINVREWLRQTKQSTRLIEQLWEPLCLATLNTPINEASAHLLARVIRDSLGKKKRDADLLIPKQALGDLFTQPAADYIRDHGGIISLQTRVTELKIEDNKVLGVHTQHGFLKAEQVILATNPSAMTTLLNSSTSFTEPDYYPIATVYLQYPDHCRLSKPMIGLSNTTSQWLFDRSEQHPGLMAVVISGPGTHEKMNNVQLAEHVAAEIGSIIEELTQQPLSHWVIREKRATFAAKVNCEQARPNYKTDIAHLWLAGDYVSNHYPATLEGAIINGTKAAQLTLSQ